MKSRKIVKDLRTLKSMAKRDLIELHSDTGKTFRPYGTKWKCIYIKGAKGKNQFYYKGKLYGITYFDGCFSPFVIEL